MIYILIWILLGSIGLNLMWIKTNKLNNITINILKKKLNLKNRKEFTNYEYFKGFILGLISGVFTLIFMIRK